MVAEALVKKLDVQPDLGPGWPRPPARQQALPAPAPFTTQFVVMNVILTEVVVAQKPEVAVPAELRVHGRASRQSDARVELARADLCMS